MFCEYPYHYLSGRGYSCPCCGAWKKEAQIFTLEPESTALEAQDNEQNFLGKAKAILRNALRITREILEDW